MARMVLTYLPGEQLDTIVEVVRIGSAGRLTEQERDLLRIHAGDGRAGS
jgi:hypothetical protein